MGLYYRVFLIQTALIYSGICLHYNQDDEDFLQYESEESGEINLKLIGTNFFLLEWDQINFDGDGNFTVNVSSPLITDCEVDFNCTESPCKFDTRTKYNNDVCGFSFLLQACNETHVSVARGNTTSSTTFNIAPAINNVDIVPKLLLTGDKVTMTWDTPASSDDDVTCAKKARIELKVGSDQMIGPIKDVSPGTATKHEWTPLGPCQHGDLLSRVVYITQVDGNYIDTDREAVDKDNLHYPGTGITTVTAKPSQEICSLYVSWGVFCDGAHHYTVTCDGKSTEVNDMNVTINGLKATSYVVAVQAFWSEKEEMGEEFSIDPEEVPAVAPDAPTLKGVDGSDDTPKKLTVSWGPPTTPSCAGEIKGYTITYRETDGTDNPPVQAGADQTSQDLTDLKPCTDYTVSVVADWSGVTGDAGTKKSTTGSQAPGTPTVKVESVDTATINLSWTENATDSCPITGYKVNWTPSDGEGQDDGGLDTSYTITGLTCNKDYTVNVTAHAEVDGKDSIPFSKDIKTADQAPGQTTVDNVLPVQDNSKQLYVTWIKPAYDCIGSSLKPYIVTWTAAGDNLPTGTTPVDETSYKINGLIPCTNYTISVAANSNTGIPGKSGTGTANTTVEIQSMTDISRKSYTPYSLVVNWTEPMDNPCIITNYTVKWVNISDGAKLEHNVTELFYNITGLDACTDYIITVTAYTKKGPGEQSVKTMRTGTDAPPVDEVNITAKSRHAQVTWNNPETACNLTFTVQYNGTTQWTYNQITDPGKPQNITDPNVTADLDDLLPFTDYTVCVTVVDGKTTCNTFVTEPDVPSAPKDVAVNGSLVNDVSLTLMWQYPEEENGIIENYVVSWRLGSGSFTNSTVNANVTSYRISGLSKGNYSFTVSVNNSMGFSDQSEPVYRWMTGRPNPCDGGCIAGIVVGVLLVMALVVTGVIFRDRIRSKFSTKSPLIEESPYELKGAAILKIDFKRHVEDMELDGATAAYQMLNDQSPQKNKFAASKPFNKGKNRYANIHPFDDTRVKLQLVGNGPKGSDYINANHVTFPDTSSLQFIASQGPVDNTISDFWRMVWEHGVYDIVMLCNLVEKGKTKCAQYWTDSGEKAIEFGEFKIYCHTEEEDVRNQCITRYIDIVKNDQRRIVKQHHYFAWPDFGVPDNEDDMLKFLASVKGNSNSHAINILVHCSAGVGRTGTFIGLWVLTSILDENKYAKSIDVHKIALMMRECRSDMVQTKAQYLYLHKCLLKYMENMENQGPVSNEDQEDPIYGNVNMGYQ